MRKKQHPTHSSSHSRITDFIIVCLGLLLKLIALHESPAALLSGIQRSLKGFLGCFLTGGIRERENSAAKGWQGKFSLAAHLN